MHRTAIHDVASTLALLKIAVCQQEACSPCVSHKGTKESATVTDWMLHTALVPLSERACSFACARLFLWRWQFHAKFLPEKERKTAIIGAQF